MATSARAKIVTPDSGAGADVPAVMLAMGQSLEPSLIPRFLNVAARNSAITSAILAADPLGGEGLRCYVQGIGEMVYDGANWVSSGPYNLASFSLGGSGSFDASAGQGDRGIPNINTYTYTLPRTRNIRVTVSGIVLSGDTVGQQYRLVVKDNATVFTDLRQNITVTGGPGAIYEPNVVTPLLKRTPGTYTITATLTCQAGAGTVSVNNGLTVTISDESAGA